jgi:tRNA pseudouridine55 synthase
VTRPASTTPVPARKRWRVVDGIVLLDKPAGLTSTQALQRVRRALQAEKAGHAGTLDPMATGMLPLCFGQATKACGALLGQRKAYRATVRLGSATDTGDAEGGVVAQREVPPLSMSLVEAVLDGLQGDREQVPPMYSALKRDGRPLYELARRGETVERAARPITIERLELVGRSDHDLEIEVVCSKGTYVRVLAEEIATGLGTLGHLAGLRRLWVDPFPATGLVTLERIEADLAAALTLPAWLQPADAAFPGLAPVLLDQMQSLHVRQGRSLLPPAGLAGGPRWRAYDTAHGFLGLLELGPDGRLRVVRLFVAGAGGSSAPQT